MQQLRLFTCILLILLCKKSSQRDRIQFRVHAVTPGREHARGSCTHKDGTLTSVSQLRVRFVEHVTGFDVREYQAVGISRYRRFDFLDLGSFLIDSHVKSQRSVDVDIT